MFVTVGLDTDVNSISMCCVDRNCNGVEYNPVRLTIRGEAVVLPSYKLTKSALVCVLIESKSMMTICKKEQQQ